MKLSSRDNRYTTVALTINSNNYLFINKYLFNYYDQ